MATAGPDVKIRTIEADPQHKEVAEKNIAGAGLSGQLIVHLGRGLDVLPKLEEEVTAGKRQPFQFVFIDADKNNNLTYFGLAMDMTRPCAAFFIDNMVRRGQLADPEAAKEDPRGCSYGGDG
jgi:predicted O-methyltransferase YrrM